MLTISLLIQFTLVPFPISYAEIVLKLATSSFDEATDYQFIQ